MHKLNTVSASVPVTRSFSQKTNHIESIICCVEHGQREGWFHLKHPILTKTEAKAAEILRERLKTLEQTASLLARAEVKKGNLKAMNRHPDYEFFLSRQRW